MSINGKHKGLSKSDLLKIANDNNIKGAEKTIEHIKQIVINWEDYATKAKVSSLLFKTIKDTLVAFTFK